MFVFGCFFEAVFFLFFATSVFFLVVVVGALAPFPPLDFFLAGALVFRVDFFLLLVVVVVVVEDDGFFCFLETAAFLLEVFITGLFALLPPLFATRPFRDLPQAGQKSL